METDNPRACQRAKLTMYNVTTVKITCELNACHYIRINIILTNPNSNVIIECKDSLGCDHATITILPNVDDLMYQVNFKCNGPNACMGALLSTVGNADLHLNCNGNSACHRMIITSAALETTPSGHFDIQCVNGDLVCESLFVNALVTASVNITCGYGNIGNNSCHNINVFCPIYPLDAYSDKCYIDFGNNAYNIEIYTTHSGVQPSVINAPLNSNIQVYCELDWFYNEMLGNQNNNYCKDRGMINNIEIIIPNQDSIPKSINCNSNKDCYIYMTKIHTNITTINCPTEANLCSVVWYVIILHLYG